MGCGDLISRVLGREIKVESLALNSLGNGPGPMKAMCDHDNHRGLLGNSLTLTAILGRQPRSLESFVEELARGSV
jgi:hypothetical protein